MTYWKPRAGLAFGLLSAFCSCRSQPAEPAPAQASYEVASAAPGARGARAAGTDAAPPAPNEHELAEPDTDEDDEAPGAGVPTDGGMAPDAGSGVAL
ncbi:MAG: hypothetical protein ABI488_03120 [Polyangiaceae bacterium]